jgi:hypothetical protein
LLFYTFGAQSTHLTTTVRSLPSQKEKDDFLFAHFRPYYTLLPSYDAENPACQPTACFATDWLGDELAGNGSYANFQQGLAEGDQDVVAMRTGVPAEGVWLAGEHTAPFVALGTVTGAYWSGKFLSFVIFIYALCPFLHGCFGGSGGSGGTRREVVLLLISSRSVLQYGGISLTLVVRRACWEEDSVGVWEGEG